MSKVLIGMSGGVDSSAAAYLLKQQGYEVIGVTMVLFHSNNEEGCAAKNAVNDARKVCEHLGIEHHVLDYSNEFKKRVMDDFRDAYLNARTPNPCVECNRFLKFGKMWEFAKSIGCDYIATGHYAKVENGKLEKIDSKKDQTYFLYNLDKEVLPHIVFPLNCYETKDQIREIAKEAGLSVASKKDSQDVCFIDGDYTDFLEANIDKLPPKGKFKYKDGTILGEHKGIIYYTIGQRKGLGIAYEHPLYVMKIDPIKNEVILGDESDIQSTKIIVDHVNRLVDTLPNRGMGKVRYGAALSPCTIEDLGDELKITFDSPVRSATPGQSLVIYDGNVCLGGGKIKSFK